MLLKELKEEQKFMFEDRRTPLAPANVRGNYSAQGTFIYKGVANGACPKLLHVEQNTEITVVSGTYFRHVLIIF